MEPIIIVPCVYILELENDNFYVGITNNLNMRLAQHFTGSGSQWTKLHKPIKIEKVYYDCRQCDERRITLEYMAKKGWEKVRGAGWAKPNLQRPPDDLCEIS